MPICGRYAAGDGLTDRSRPVYPAQVRGPGSLLRATMKLPYSYAARSAGAPRATRGLPRKPLVRRLFSRPRSRSGSPQASHAVLSIALLACGLLVSTRPLVTVSAGTVPSFDHVFLIVMENHAYSQIINSSSAPYINSLAKK